LRDLRSAQLGGISARVRVLTVALAAAMTALGFGFTAASANAAVPEKTDVMFIFDTSGSMGGVLTETKEEIKTLIGTLKGALPNIEFGVASVEDIPGYDDGSFIETLTEAQYEENAEKPWRLWQGLTAEQSKVEAGINELPEGGGGDLPEAYGRALWEAATNPEVGWRTGARHEIVLIGDNVPHNPDLNLGIPPEFQFTEPFNDGFEGWPNTGEEPEGKFGIKDTQWKPGDSLDFHHTLQMLNSEQKPLAMVDYHHTNQFETENYVHYWEYWASETGGQAISSEEGSRTLDAHLAEIIVEGAEGIPPCKPGLERLAPGTPCRPIPVVKHEEAPLPLSPVVHLGAKEKHFPVVLLEGELEWELEFPEAGEAEFEAELQELAELSSVHGQLEAQTARHGHKKCKAGTVRKHGKCVSRAPVRYGKGKLTVTTPGTYKLHFKPTARILKALKKGKKLNIRLHLVFTPAGTTVHIPETASVKLHLIKKPKHHHHHKK